MGTKTVTRIVSNIKTPEALKLWFKDTLEEMAAQSGTDAYCGNWNANKELLFVPQSFASHEAAENYAEKHRYSSGPVLALKVGDFNKLWPVTKAQVSLLERREAIGKELNEFDYQILKRAQAQKTKLRKCPHCSSQINVKALQLPELKDLTQNRRGGDDYIVYRFGRYLVSTLMGMTDCPVCTRNLLKTDTDQKKQDALKLRYNEIYKQVQESQREHEKMKTATKEPAPYWYVTADCKE